MVMTLSEGCIVSVFTSMGFGVEFIYPVLPSTANANAKYFAIFGQILP